MAKTQSNLEAGKNTRRKQEKLKHRRTKSRVTNEKERKYQEEQGKGKKQ
jgi:hypothetical protein